MPHIHIAAAPAAAPAAASAVALTGAPATGRMLAYAGICLLLLEAAWMSQGLGTALGHDWGLDVLHQVLNGKGNAVRNNGVQQTGGNGDYIHIS